MNRNLILISMTVLALGLAACKDKTKTEVTDKSVVNGTTTESTTSTESTTDENGNVVKQETDKTTTVDPEGLMNKKTIEDTHQETTTQPPQ